MRLALNTFVYEVGNVPITQALRSAHALGFEMIEYAAYHSGDPTTMSKEQRRDIITMFSDLGLRTSQLLLANTAQLASCDTALRQQTLDYMKQCADFALETGGRQVLICWGCGVYESAVLKELSWLNAVSAIREYAEWGMTQGVLVDLELDPHVYFIVNSTHTMTRMLEDVDMPNVFPNVDIGHLCITREAPHTLEKLRDRILHVHLSETDSFAHTNSIIGTGCADFPAYIAKVRELGIEQNCASLGEVAVAGIEMGEPGGEVDDPERWVRDSLNYLAATLPELTR